MRVKPVPSVAWLLVFEWILASLIGWAAGLVGGLLLTLAAAGLPGVNEDRLYAYAVLLSIGLATGVAQWRVMARRLPRSERWIAATLAGALLSLVLLAGSNLARLPAAGMWGNALFLALIGTAFGICQWWILRRHFRRAGVWVLACATGYLCFLWFIEHPAHSPGEFIALGMLAGAAASAVPGVALAWLARQPRVAAS
jgi:hypothetical protein